MSKHIRKKLLAMEIDVTEIEIHNSSLTRTLRCYVTLARTTNLKALRLAEQMVCNELEEAFAIRPHAFYWRYLPPEKAKAARASAAEARQIEAHA
ncbi:MAG: hypothetical protein ACLGI6_07365 [Gammaproteobacteria bacterium]